MAEVNREVKIDAMKNLDGHPDFAVYLNELKNEFDTSYKKLRKCPRDSAFYKIQGRLDGLEFALNIAKIIKNRE